MNILHIYAHFEARSFNAAMRRTALSALERAGHAVDALDLYAEGFDPRPHPSQFRDRAENEHFDLMREQAHANATGTTPEEVASMQARVARADVLIFQFPMWWWSMPAILKGWIDRVFSNGFAYGDRTLAGKSAMLCLTAETKAKRFAPEADFPLLRHIEFGMLEFCSLEVLPAFVVPEVLTISDEARADALKRFEAHIADHFAPVTPA